ICGELASWVIHFFVIQNNPRSFEELERDRVFYLAMDATNEDALLKAGIMYARGIVPAVVDFAGIALMDRHPGLLMEEYRTAACRENPRQEQPAKGLLRHHRVDREDGRRDDLQSDAPGEDRRNRYPGDAGEERRP
ncbi:MAG TPA: NAD-binding protein, partial [Spirochaetota bacterium]|nr:NAD-binding protein [Spirochaetota bacterium]